MGQFFITDLETENHKYRGDIASPFDPRNYIVAPAYAVDDGPVQYWYFGSPEEAEASDWFQVPEDCRFLVAHNASFEMLWFLCKHRKEFEAFLKRGGRVLCTQLAEYMLSDMTLIYPTLDETAVQHGGTPKIDAVKLLWEQGYLTSQIDKDLLLEYLAGPQGDIENTRLCIFDQVELLQERGMWDVYLIRCEALLYSAYCKFFGMHVNAETAQEDKAALQATIQRLQESLLPLLPKDMPEDCRNAFNWGSDYQLSALLFGGPIKYDTKVSYDPPKYEKVECYQDLDGVYYPVDTYSSLESGNPAFITYKSGKNKGSAKVFSIDSNIEKLKWATAVWQCPGVLDLYDLPEGVSRDFLDKRGQFRGKRYQCDAVRDASDRIVSGTPVWSTSREALESVQPYTDSPLPTLLLELADAEKIHGTYYEGMLADVSEDGFLRRGINHVSTITGRLSSGLQQMPRGGTVKRMFDSRFEGGHISEVDYTALEVVHLATLSGDKELLRYLQNGTDMHCLRLSSQMHRPYEEILAINKDEQHPEHNLIHELRQAIKPKSFQFQYGGTAQGIAFKTGCTVEEAQEFIDNELKLFPESSAYRYKVLDIVETSAAQQGYSREQSDDGSWQVYKRGYFTGPSGTRFCFRQYPKNVWEKGQCNRVMQFKLPQVANYPNQGEASLVTQTATGLIIRWLIQNDFFQDQVLPINTVHDACYTDSHPDYTLMAVKQIKALMEYAPKLMAHIFPEYAALGIADIPYPAVPEYGPNMGEKHKVD